jgi:protoporphyrin/coproporphyrin ferrochelatase
MLGESDGPFVMVLSGNRTFFGARANLTRMSERIGILVAQLGTPDAPTAPAVRTYLRQFLSDRRVVDLNRAVWLPILHGIVLNTRPAKSAELYRKVWTADGSPLLSITRRQAAGLQERLSAGGVAVRAEVAMRYGNPSTGAAIRKLVEWGAERILLFPMYPQYSAATTGSTCDEVFDELKALRFVPALRVVPPYFQDASYINSLAQSARDRIAGLPARPDKVVLSFHGIPQRYASLGDPYPEHCKATARSLASAMNWTSDDYLVTFQSRFGREPWLQPYTDETLASLGRQGLENLLVLCPGFTADCLETIDEIGHLGHEQFRGAGGGSLHLVECVNDREDWLEAMAAIARRELAGWI